MQFIESKLNAAIETARAKANGNRAILNAIEKAAIGLRGGWIVTELHDGLLITSDSGETYHANGTCSCAAYKNGMICKHRIAYRIVELYHAAELETTPKVETKPAPVRAPSRITKSIEQNHNGQRLTVYRADGWSI